MCQDFQKMEINKTLNLQVIRVTEPWYLYTISRFFAMLVDSRAKKKKKKKFRNKKKKKREMGARFGSRNVL